MRHDDPLADTLKQLNYASLPQLPRFAAPHTRELDALREQQEREQNAAAIAEFDRQDKARLEARRQEAKKHRK